MGEESTPVYLDEFINWEVAYFEGVQLLGSANDICDECGSNDMELRFKAKSKKDVGKHTFVLKVFDETTGSIKTKTFNVLIKDPLQEIEKEYEKVREKAKARKDRK